MITRAAMLLTSHRLILAPDHAHWGKGGNVLSITLFRKGDIRMNGSKNNCMIDTESSRRSAVLQQFHISWPRARLHEIVNKLAIELEEQSEFRYSGTANLYNEHSGPPPVHYGGRFVVGGLLTDIEVVPLYTLTLFSTCP